MFLSPLSEKKTWKCKILHGGKVVWVRISQIYLTTWVVHLNTPHILGHGCLGISPMCLTFLMSTDRIWCGGRREGGKEEAPTLANKSMSSQKGPIWETPSDIWGDRDIMPGPGHAASSLASQPWRTGLASVPGDILGYQLSLGMPQCSGAHTSFCGGESTSALIQSSLLLLQSGPPSSEERTEGQTCRKWE